MKEIIEQQRLEQLETRVADLERGLKQTRAYLFVLAVVFWASFGILAFR